MPRMSRMLIATAAVLLVPLAVACSSREGRDGDDAGQPTTEASVAAIAPSTQTGSSDGGETAGRVLSVADLVRLAENAVVRIETNSGVGSGVIVDPDGYVITNNHVISGTGRTPSIRVQLSDGAEYQASVVGADPRADLAVLKIDASGLTALDLAELDDVVVGQDVVAIGYALDLKGGEGPSFTVTRGIISAKNRGIDEASTILGAVQTDAAINHGNSGGPLLDLYGRVVGINTALAPDLTTGGVANGIGFAVGSDTVRAVYDEIRENGRVNRGLLGIRDFEALRPATARTLKVPLELGGVYLDNQQDLAAQGPAERAGIKGGDVIVKVGATAVENESDLAIAMIYHHPGETVPVEVYRDGAKLTVNVTLGTPAS